ncbi:MAG: GPW/gp25 family protein [Planctomycetes bacterium]|nr:GPW/gp25 family protein [Planctomycetota bacterium]
MAAFRCYDFAHPDRFGIGAGFTTTPAGALRIVHGEDSIRQAIVMLLSTSPGERVMRPHYGCDLRRLVFQPADATTAGLAVHAVRTALRRYEPRIELLRVDAGPAPDHDAALLIEVDYRIRTTGRIESLAYLFHLGVPTR